MMTLFLRRLLILAVFSFGLSHAADDRNLGVQSGTAVEKRIALVIGNSSYPGAPLKNPVNDAKDMAAALRKLGFEVINKTDATQKEMNLAIAQFGDKLRADTVALFFFAGHGMQVKGKNYIIPIDAQITSESTVRAMTVDVDTVMDQLASSPMNIVILDACRNNPFERRFRSVGGGLAQMDAPKGSLIAYATAPGKVAQDGEGRNGLYTQELLKHIQTPGLPLEAVFKRVRNGVMQGSGDAQTPWEASSLTGDFYFRHGKIGQDTQIASITSVPEAPNGVGVSLDDIRRQQEAKAKWDSWQVGMKLDFNKVTALTAEPELQVTAWDRFLSVYTQKNPFSDDDDQLRADARNRRQIAEGEKLRRISPRPTVTSTASATTSKVFRDCPDCPEMIAIPPGSFDMGLDGSAGLWISDTPVHKVMLSQFSLGKTEVTRRQWASIMGTNHNMQTGCDECPVNGVTWNDAKVFVSKLTQKTGKTYRLPSEAEWEYACRGGEKYKYCGSDNADEVAWHSGNSEKRVHPVGGKKPNAFGLHDMSGNISEWVEDCVNGNYDGAPTDGSAWLVGNCQSRVIRGGAVYVPTAQSGAAYRRKANPTTSVESIGFRVARVIP